MNGNTPGFWTRYLAAVVVMAAVSTMGDFIWAYWHVSHRMWIGVVHGVVLCSVLGIMLGAALSGRRGLIPGLLGEIGVGLVASISFYVLYPWLGIGAMFLSWIFLWNLTSMLAAQLSRSTESWVRGALRGLSAALLSAAGFYAISGIWLGHGSGGPDYALNFAAWCLPFALGLGPLLWGRGGSAAIFSTSA